MASGTITADYPGRPYYLRLNWYTVENNIGGNYSRYGWDLAAVSKTGWGSYNYACGNWFVHVAGHQWAGCQALVFIPGDFAGKTIGLGSGQTGPVYHDGNGYLNFQIATYHAAPGPFGTADAGWRWVSGDRIPKPPAAPSMGGVVAGSTTTTSFGVSYSRGADNGSPIDKDQVQWSTDPGFGTIVWDDTPPNGNPSGYSDPVGGTPPVVLAPGTQHWVRARSHNAIGWSAWSAVATGTTIPATPPGITITPLISGLGANATMSPPGGVTGVTEYNVQYRPVLGGATVDRTTTGTVVAVTSGLTPGVAYEWRANAEIGGYTSPWTDWYAVTQPSPNTHAGDFFSGATADTADTNFEWAGDAQNSISLALLNVITGWMTFNQGNDDSGGTGVVGQVAASLVGGFRGDRLAKVIFHSDTDSEGFIAGVGFAGAGVVEPGAFYVGSLHVRVPDRDQRMQGGVAWYNASEAIIDIEWGEESVLTASATTFSRVTASGIAPAGAVRGAPVVRDVSGTDWAAWQGGDSFYMDGAMLTLNLLFPYFDGSYADSIYDTNEYDYQWLGAPNASQSVRYNIDTTGMNDPLADPDCTPLPAPPMPPVIPSECIEEVGVWRRYIVQVPAGEVRQWAATLPTLLLTTGSVAERQVRIRYFPNEEGVPPESVDTTTWVAEQILTYIPPRTVITLDGVTQRVRAEVNGAASISANHLLYGTNGTPASWPELRCGVGYIVTLDVPTDAPSGNLEAQLLLTQRV